MTGCADLCKCQKVLTASGARYASKAYRPAPEFSAASADARLECGLLGAPGRVQLPCQRKVVAYEVWLKDVLPQI